MKWAIGVFLVAAAAMIVVSFSAGRGSRHGQVINCIGSTSIEPFAEMLSEEYSRVNPSVTVEVQGGGSTAGLQAVFENIADIGTCSRSLKEDEAAKCRGITIASDGLAIVVHKSNPVSNLTCRQIRDIFSGRITNWKELGGTDCFIEIITREEGSGTREAFVKLVMEGGEKTAGLTSSASSTLPTSAPEGCPPNAKNHVRISRKAMTQESNGAVKELVKNNAGAIGYMSLGLVKGEVKILAVDGVYPTIQEVIEKRYPLVRPFLFVVKGKPSPAAQAFIDYVLSPQGQHLLEKEGLVPVR